MGGRHIIFSSQSNYLLINLKRIFLAKVWRSRSIIDRLEGSIVPASDLVRPGGEPLLGGLINYYNTIFINNLLIYRLSVIRT